MQKPEWLVRLGQFFSTSSEEDIKKIVANADTPEKLEGNILAQNSALKKDLETAQAKIAALESENKDLKAKAEKLAQVEQAFEEFKGEAANESIANKVEGGFSSIGTSSNAKIWEKEFAEGKI